MVFANQRGVPLRRSPDHHLIGGVCGGIAQWLGMDPWAVRALYVVISMLSASFPGILVYICLWIGLPER